ncbi:MAG: DNA polymerase III subunit chi [Holosporaceae bacterium]|jgi:DNA polymerase-3 subunit chi|nr:DNA polymerase III subunit chi [Holosporaceae bacterium]
MEISFYHTASGHLVSSLVRILEKIYVSGQRCLFCSPSEERVKAVDKALWTFSTNAFIPHGDKDFGFCDQQPIYLTSVGENPNGAVVQVLVDAFDYKSYGENFERIFFVFEDLSQAERAEMLYADLKNNSKNVNYWRQSTKGWEKVV